MIAILNAFSSLATLCGTKCQHAWNFNNFFMHKICINKKRLTSHQTNCQIKSY